MTGVTKEFRQMGARVTITTVPNLQAAGIGVMDQLDRRQTGLAKLATVRIDIQRDRQGEYFDVVSDDEVQLEVSDVRPADRHLLLSAHVSADDDVPVCSAFLCGHDEKSWFVAAIPESAEANDVQSAMDALKPQAVWDAMEELAVPPEHRDRRRTAAFIRQGEWFFIPRPDLSVGKRDVLKDEPIQRGAGKPHRCQFLYRSAGEQVYVCRKYADGLTLEEYQELSRADQRREVWRIMVRNAQVYAKGNIRHPDHKTVWLSFWHEVVMNTETEARGMENVAFLD